MKRIPLLIATLFMSQTIWSQVIGGEEKENRVWIQSNGIAVSQHNGWKNQWNGGLDLEFGTTVINNWAIWVNLGVLFWGNETPTLSHDGINMNDYYANPIHTSYHEGEDGSSGRVRLGFGIAYIFDKSRFNIIPRLGFYPMSFTTVSWNGKQDIKKIGANEYYELRWDNKRTRAWGSLGVDTKYKLNSKFYVNLGIDYHQRLTKERVERQFINTLTSETVERRDFRGKYPSSLELRAGVGIFIR